MGIADDAARAGVTVDELGRIRLSEILHGMLCGEVPGDVVEALRRFAEDNGAGLSPGEIEAIWHDVLHFDGRAVGGIIGQSTAKTADFAVASLRDFLAIERPELRYYIPGLLPDQGKLLLTAAAKVGKTFWALNLALCLAGGYCQWLGIDFGEPANVLMLQPELSDGLMAARLNWVLKTAPHGLNLEDAMQNLNIWQCDVSRPVLNNGALAHVEAVIAETKPEVVICDPLYALFPGLVENAAEEMTVALDLLTGWTARHGCAVVLTHHHSKNGTSRGSSVLQGWPETDLSMSFVPDDRAHVKVDGLFRCTFGDDWPKYWAVPDRESAWFRESDSDWVSPTGSRSRDKLQKASDVAFVLREAGGPGLSYSALVKALVKALGMSEPTAKRRVQEAAKGGLIGTSNGVYYAK